jgi:hypothetical protein
MSEKLDRNQYRITVYADLHNTTTFNLLTTYVVVAESCA